ncbi:hypothetical protein [Roseimicrobium sp. ORNL1]|uniref:hypothetical protein n=1 Tax=Roseimicrobium sp. ORNL1 TaxID=2711231 RepID=UPI0013E18C0F|nr:hypothetical protein [Roseimicrobium sp. ORNL1]QIF05816.1 hypothetical protein G5S37_31425 [Roseimicrobium sp. ORNL1]
MATTASARRTVRALVGNQTGRTFDFEQPCSDGGFLRLRDSKEILMSSLLMTVLQQTPSRVASSREVAGFLFVSLVAFTSKILLSSTIPEYLLI